MAINEIINFSIKNLNGEAQKESATLNLKVPEYCTSLNLPDKSNYIIYRAFQAQATNERQGTTSTKTRAEVRGDANLGNKKEQAVLELDPIVLRYGKVVV